MDIRTKLVFALVAVALGSMLAVGALAYSLAGEYMMASTFRQLTALAETKRDGLENVVIGWHDRANLIASRTQLRVSLRVYNRSGGREPQEQIHRILMDAHESLQTVRRLAVYDANLHPVASTGTTVVDTLPDLEPSRLPAEGGGIQLERISFDADNDPQVSLVAPLILDGERIGAIRVELSASELIDLTEDYTGLGDTGETLIVLRDSSGNARVLHPMRHGPVAAGSLYPERVRDPVHLALRGMEDTFSEDLVDYRGRPVWAATRYLDGVDLALVVKFDAAEEREPIHELRRRLTRLAVALSAFAILLGTLLGLRFARPIHELAEAANRIRLGDWQARAAIRSEDEIGLLARTFNRMAEELERRMTEPRSKDDPAGERESETPDPTHP